MKLLYKPFGLLAGILSGLLARRLFTALWGAIDDEEPPEPTTERASWPRVVGAAAVQGATFAATRAVVDRAGAKGFAHLFGVWPGEREPDRA
jgi:pectin methylesterase-like acyl-CoA thioesterase